MIIFLYGKESFLIHKQRNEIKQKFFQEYPQAMLDTFDIEEGAGIKKIRESLSSGGGLFSSQKMIDIRSPFVFSLPEQEELIAILKAGEKSEDMTVVVSAEPPKDKKNKLLAYLKKVSSAKEIGKLQGLDLKKWISDQIVERSQQKISIHNTAVDKLMLVSKNNLWNLDAEIEKLVCYKTEGMITIEDINILCQGEMETKIFDLVNAISRKDKARANDLVFHLLKSGENEFYIFTMILFQLRNLLRVYDCQKKGMFSAEAISKTLSMHPYVATKTLGQLRNFSLPKLKQMYDLSARLDYQVKIGQRDMQEALTYFIASL